MKKKVSVLKCSNYNYKNIKKILLKSIEDLGGLDKYVNKSERVLLKVNLLAKRKPEEAVTTHPAFVRALAEIFIENGNQVLIGDSPGGPFTEKILTSLYSGTGIKDVAEKTGAKLNFNVASKQKENPHGLLLKNLTVTSMIDDVDKIISVSKLKTHRMMTFTGAVKNMFGIVPGLIKGEYHLNMKDYNTFGSALVDVCMCANPVLSFMDGIEAMEGEGPAAGTVRKMNTIIASESPYHLDKVACTLIGLDLKKVPTILSCIERGICCDGLKDVELKGIPIEKLMIKDFVIPETSMLSLKILSSPIFSKFFNTYLQPKPVFNKELCVGCKVCAKNCPAKVIKMKNKKPVVLLKDCIRCCCCQELCPKKAVSIHRPTLLKKITGK